MKAITFLLKAKQPILATSFEGDPNSDVSYSYILGSMIRGALIGRYLKINRLGNTDILADGTVRRLFFDGTTRYLNAYPCSQTGKRTLPILLSWRKEKGAELKDESDGMGIFDFSIRKPSKEVLDSPKAISEPFWVEEDGLRLYTIDRRINIHTFRDRSKGRSTENEGEIFRYDAIDAGQTFQGVILCDDSDEKIIQDLLITPDIWLGGSRSAGYGHVEISQVKSHNGWNEVGIAPEKRVGDNILKVTLLSDLILRDECGQYTAIPPTNLLFEVLGINLDKPSNAYMDSTFIGGFNRKWGLPLPQVSAVKAGSVFVYENVEINPDKINILETEGIGERKTEGFGRVAVNWCTEECFTAKKPKALPRKDKPQFKTSESRELARQIGERILRQRLEQLLLAQIEPRRLQANQMTNSQLSRLMIVTRQALDKNSREPLDTLFSQVTKSSRSKYESAKLGNQPLEKIIKQWLDNPREWMGTEIKDILIGDEKCSLSDSLAMEYTLRLIMAVAKNATKDKADE
ncbi:RAMP superfamily CRISPR-associated protein [Nostoc sp.]|uniref:RAMP superfamily CRISPR-associated protein n=1 Tax=Nostoc sp. TaxID=1180 RepID=UPI002FF72D84